MSNEFDARTALEYASRRCLEYLKVCGERVWVGSLDVPREQWTEVEVSTEPVYLSAKLAARAAFTLHPELRA